MTYFQMELIVLTLSSFVVGLLIGLLLAIAFNPGKSPQRRKSTAEKCPWCGKYKRKDKLCKCEK